MCEVTAQAQPTSDMYAAKHFSGVQNCTCGTSRTFQNSLLKKVPECGGLACAACSLQPAQCTGGSFHGVQAAGFQVDAMRAASLLTQKKHVKLPGLELNHW